EARELVLSAGRDAGSLGLELSTLGHKQRYEHAGDGGEDDEQGQEYDSDRDRPRDPELGEAIDQRADQERNQGAQNEGSDHVADEVDDADAHDERGNGKRDLEGPATRNGRPTLDDRSRLGHLCRLLTGNRRQPTAAAWVCLSFGQSASSSRARMQRRQPRAV